MIRETTHVNLTYDAREGRECLLIRLFPNPDGPWEPFAESYVPQSGKALVTFQSNGGLTKAQNVLFTDGDEAIVSKVESYRGPSSNISLSSDDSLQQFFSRPVMIDSFIWEQLSAFGLASRDLNLWNLYMSNPRVSNRISNYSLIRGDVHVKILISGGPFYYGRLIAAMHPHARSDQFNGPTPYDEFGSLTPLSQLPHVFLNPTNSQGGEISIPFLNGTEFFSCGFAFSDATTGYDNTACLYIRQLAALHHANGATPGVRVKVFMWLENVEMSMLTSSSPGNMVAQMGKERDEANHEGLVSGPATAIANAASVAANIPLLAPYAKATEGLARGVASMAKTLGYSRPEITKAPEPMNINLTGSMAMVTAPDTSAKLTWDDKQETAVDSKGVGLVEADPLAIASIAQRESFLENLYWNQASGSGDRLATFTVQPFYLISSTDTGFYLPAVSLASLPFQYWTGTLKFRFMISCSSHHKGRLRIIWDPDLLTTDSRVEYNVNDSHVVDLAETQDFTVSVGWGQSAPYAPRYTLDYNFGEQWKFGNDTFGFKPSGNGVLAIDILSELTVPDDSANSVAISVFLSAGDDFAVAEPANDVLDLGYMAQSGRANNEAPEATGTVEMGMPEQNYSVVNVGGQSSIDTTVNSVYFGERMSSLRPLLKRYTRVLNLDATTSDGFSVSSTVRLPHFLPTPGNVTAGMNSSITYGTYNYVNSTLFQLISSCFAFHKGSTRWKLMSFGAHSYVSTESGERTSLPVQTAFVARVAGQTAVPPIYRQTVGNSSNITYKSLSRMSIENDTVDYDVLPSMVGGGAATNLDNKALEWQVPFASMHKLASSRWINKHNTNCPVAPDLGVFCIHLAGIGSHNSYPLFMAMGDDYQTFFWLGAPKLYRHDTVPI